MPPDAPTLRVARRGAVATLTLNRPAVLNALDQTMVGEFLAAARDVAADAGVRAVVLAGSGRAFMAGGDIGSFQRAGGDAPAVIGRLIAPFHETLQVLATMDKPLLASVHGAVAGAGVSLMLAADLAIAADDIAVTLAYTRLGTSADGGASWSLPRVVGLRKAMEIALLSGTYDAAEALRLSLVNRVVPAADLAAETERLADRLADGPTVALGAMKRLLRGSLDRTLPEQLAAEAESFQACAATADFREGVDAFLAKRPARFAGR
ncbi:1,2-epoxyphenylacetyl-CoA isomerase [Methylobacterium crusticola]|uniref:1,2-epoxyphenylacetyl-CoA isomerase n=1 Tax=Methylobacterium crusticola TaxID=1697972 RepID=A0ABQ4R0F3_9HYPH|nr:enoyl-CoA hydratase-related protein [Methylobacterium crusticola]GJD50346.1 1,2-epoxyphenylacetyl-CoA isomerase [Methylobacterium crusticola]